VSAPTPGPVPAAAPAPIVSVVMGSASDLDVMAPASEILSELGLAHEVRVVSAHRTPTDLVRYATEAAERGLRAIIAGAGGAAHLPGMLAALTPLPVIGVPVPLRHLDGMDSLLSIVQMPAGVPVATVGVGNARNAALLAGRILATSDPALQARIVERMAEAAAMARAQDLDVRTHHPSPDHPPTTDPGAAS
jgi:5-(carboxyamino)imidazole ribonucleotide mutase